jgi:hypothetical protein
VKQGVAVVFFYKMTKKLIRLHTTAHRPEGLVIADIQAKPVSATFQSNWLLATGIKAVKLIDKKKTESRVIM